MLRNHEENVKKKKKRKKSNESEDGGVKKRIRSERMRESKKNLDERWYAAARAIIKHLITQADINRDFLKLHTKDLFPGKFADILSGTYVLEKEKGDSSSDENPETTKSQLKAQFMRKKRRVLNVAIVEFIRHVHFAEQLDLKKLLLLAHKLDPDYFEAMSDLSHEYKLETSVGSRQAPLPNSSSSRDGQIEAKAPAQAAFEPEQGIPPSAGIFSQSTAMPSSKIPATMPMPVAMSPSPVAAMPLPAAAVPPLGVALSPFVFTNAPPGFSAEETAIFYQSMIDFHTQGVLFYQAQTIPLLSAMLANEQSLMVTGHNPPPPLEIPQDEPELENETAPKPLSLPTPSKYDFSSLGNSISPGRMRGSVLFSPINRRSPLPERPEANKDWMPKSP